MENSGLANSQSLFSSYITVGMTENDEQTKLIAAIKEKLNSICIPAPRPQQELTSSGPLGPQCGQKGAENTIDNGLGIITLS